jgi:DNA polymerase
VALAQKQLRLRGKTRNIRPMDPFQSALASVLGTLEQIRDGGGRWPRASREVLAAFQTTRTTPPAAPALPDTEPRTKTERLTAVRERVLVCELCPHLASSRTQVVFGTGNPDAEIMFIGEAPGADEDAQGEPFVGRAGQLLTKIIKAMGFEREDVYIANVLKSRPDMPPGAPGNRPPSPEEMRNCLPFLIEQIRIVQPKALVALGATAVEGLLGTRGTMRELRGKWHSFENTPLMITYHPSYLLRNQTPMEKRKVWEDMLLVLEKIGRPITAKQQRYFLPASE